MNRGHRPYESLLSTHRVSRQAAHGLAKSGLGGCVLGGKGGVRHSHEK